MRKLPDLYYGKEITCCYQCADRTVGCHGSCEKYLKEKAERTNANYEAIGKCRGTVAADKYTRDSKYRKWKRRTNSGKKNLY